MRNDRIAKILYVFTEIHRAAHDAAAGSGAYFTISRSRLGMARQLRELYAIFIEIDRALRVPFFRRGFQPLQMNLHARPFQNQYDGMGCLL